MSLYPSIEDMKVSHLTQAQISMMGGNQSQSQPPADVASAPYTHPETAGDSLYPSLNDYMGLSLVPFQANQNTENALTLQSNAIRAIAPISAETGLAGLKRSIIKPGVSQVVLCKDRKGKVGLKVQDLDKGIFVKLVTRDSPAALAGIRFGDQILSVNEAPVAGWSTSKFNDAIKKSNTNGIVIALRDRPFERTITLQKDSAGITGFAYEGGKITKLVKDSSAARNGLLTDHYIVEVNGQNVVGLKDKKIRDIMEESTSTTTITIMPAFVYNHIIKRMGSSIKLMDHSVPDC